MLLKKKKKKKREITSPGNWREKLGGKPLLDIGREKKKGRGGYLLLTMEKGEGEKKRKKGSRCACS